MHAAGLHSDRLQRVLALLGDGRPHSTRQIVRGARVMAVNAVVAELRAHGAEIICTRVHEPSGKRRFHYTMTRAPRNA